MLSATDCSVREVVLKKNVLQLEENKMGRDFVVGDIHGLAGLLIFLMRQHEFDKTKDRVICVGDVIDRGPQSVEMINLLKSDYIYCVMGNHEQIMVDVLRHKAMNKHSWLMEGGDWHIGLGDDLIEQLLQTVEKLPYLIEFKSGNKKFGVVHAQPVLKLSWDELKHTLEGEDLSVKHRSMQIITWDRFIAKSASYDEQVAGVDAVFCGHTPMSDIKTKGNIHFIDTGAYYSGVLSGAIITNGEVEMISCQFPSSK